MRTTTITKKDKAKLVAAENAAIATLKKDFKEMRAKEDYSAMGSMFWHIFVAEDKKSKFYKAADKLWLSLSEEEMEMCENA